MNFELSIIHVNGRTLMQILRNDRLSRRLQEGGRTRKPRDPDLYKFSAVPLSTWIIIALEAMWSSRMQFNCTVKRRKELGRGDPQTSKASSSLGRRKCICQGIIAVEVTVVALIAVIVGNNSSSSSSGGGRNSSNKSSRNSIRDSRSNG